MEPDIDLADLLAARDDLAIIEKTSNANVRKFTTSAINKVIIGQVIIGAIFILVVKLHM